MTPLELHHALIDHHHIGQRQHRTTMEATRLIVMHMWNASGRVLKEIELDPQRFRMMRFDWDEETQPSVQTVDQQKAVLEQIAAMMGGKKIKKPKKVVDGSG